MVVAVMLQLMQSLTPRMGVCHPLNKSKPTLKAPKTIGISIIDDYKFLP